ncbi:polysialyltransferase family glycosyltransferase [Vibrio sp. NTOU-M3]|uniref:polysialyltransferase family glycosyltransferase n=1 Tax=Vibrio sp. NTOU-M3 TaxID=3234954 RepID=UPI00349F9E00
MNDLKKSLIIFSKSDYQLLNAIIAIRKNNQVYEELIICHLGYWNNQSLLRHHIEGHKFTFFDNENEVLSYIKNKKIDIISAKFNPLLKINLNIDKYICIDDGLGSYANFFHLYKAAIREKNTIKLKLLYPVYFFATIIMHKLGFYEKDHVYKNGEIDVEYKNHLLKILSELAIDHNANKLEIKNKNRVLFCSQPYVDLGVLSTAEYEIFLNKVQNYFGENILILKHPGDKLFSYKGYDVVECDMFEIFMANNINNISVVTSINSTCLLTASSVFDIRSISFHDEKTKNLNDSFSKEIELLWNKYIFRVGI